MKKLKAIILGIFTIMPILYIIFFISYFVHMVLNALSSTNPEPSVNFIKIILPLHLGTMVLIICIIDNLYSKCIQK